MGTWSAEFNGASSGGDSLMGITDAAQTGLAPTGDFSFWFWTELLDTGGHSGTFVCTKRHSALFQYEVVWAANDGSAIDIDVYETSGGSHHRRRFSGLSLSVGTPAHLAFTFDASAATADAQFELFKNGTSLGNGTLQAGALISGTFDSDGDFLIGGDGQGDWHANLHVIRLFDVRFYDAVVAPTTTTYKQLLANPSTETNLQLNLFRGTSNERWTMNSASVIDASTNGNDLSITHQAVADTPIEVGVWPGPSNGDVTDPGETFVDGWLQNNGPGAPGLLYADKAWRAFDGEEAVMPSFYSGAIAWRAVDGNYLSLGTGGGGGPGLVYRMRGYDTTLTETVFWDSDHVDATATDYGGPGPVTNIVLQKKLGSA